MTDKIYAIVRGGLGNQLFIYAAARALSARTGGEVVLLDDLYEDEFHGRKLLIKNFVPNCKIESRDTLPTNLSKYFYPTARHLNRYAHFFGLNTGPVFIERRKRLFKMQSERRDKRFLRFNPKGHCLLDGFFQDEWYFSTHSDLIRQELSEPSSVSEKSLKLAKTILASPNAVALHFRHTEMECQEIARRHAGEAVKYRKGTDLSFCRQAVRELQARYPDAQLFGFSDYPEWLEQHVEFDSPIHLVTHNRAPDTAHEDLYLMSLCRHHIISHSTFSWWAAWLAQRPEQMVFAPIDIDSRPKSPFYPSKWKTIKTSREWVSSQ